MKLYLPELGKLVKNKNWKIESLPPRIENIHEK